MTLRGGNFLRITTLGAASALALTFFAATALAADQPAAPVPLVIYGNGAVGMAPIPDKTPAPAKSAPAAEQASLAQAPLADGAIHYIDPNPSLTGKSDTRPTIIIKDGTVTMAPIPDGAREPRSASAAPRSELACLANAVYFEARGESARGQAAVAQVVLARKRAPGRPKTICGVVYEGSDLSTGCQFSFTCDGIADVVRDSAAFARARRIASQAINGKFKRAARGATYFHARYVRPNWASHMVKVATIGTHIFYRP